jgi:hypothetical protein
LLVFFVAEDEIAVIDISLQIADLAGPAQPGFTRRFDLDVGIRQDLDNTLVRGTPNTSPVLAICTENSMSPGCVASSIATSADLAGRGALKCSQ